MVELRQVTRADASNSARGELARHMAVARYDGGVKLSSLAVGQSAFWLHRSTPMLRRSRTVVMVALTVLGVGCSTVEDDISAVQMAAEQDDADAQHALGLAYRDGQGVDQDHAEAVRWWLQAAEQGHADAQHALGLAYRDGQGVDQDHAGAVRWWLQAAEQGLAGAQYWLGEAYRKGEGVLQ